MSDKKYIKLEKEIRVFLENQGFSIINTHSDIDIVDEKILLNFHTFFGKELITLIYDVENSEFKILETILGFVNTLNVNIINLAYRKNKINYLLNDE